MADTDATPALREHQRDGHRAAPAGVGPHAWQLVLWRLVAFVAHLMRPAAPDARSNMAFNRYLRQHPFRGVAYAVAAFVSALVVMGLMALPAVLLLERLHLRPRGAADFGVTVLAVCGLLALWFAAGRWLRRVVAGRVNRWRT
jgi:hypothetical protein